MSDTPDPPDPPEHLDDLFAAFEAGELDADPVSDDERRRMLSAARLVRRSQAGAAPPPELRAQVLERIRDEAEQAPPPVADLSAARERRRARTRRLIGAAAVAAAAAAVVAFALTRGQASSDRILFDAELAAVRTGPSPAAEGGAEIFRSKDGFEVRLEAEGLAPTTGNTTYELWYVAKGDKRRKPKRVAIGSFRTRDGTIKARWPAAFDVSRFTRVSITLEPRDDGDPRVNGPEVARGRSVRVTSKQAG